MQGLLAMVAVAAVLAGGPTAPDRTYYVRPSGSDASPGTSPELAWRTVARVNAAALRPGDQVLFEGGQVFEGRLEPQSSGLRGRLVTFSSYGAGRANLAGGIKLSSAQWLVFDRIAVDTGDWRTAAKTSGIATDPDGTGAANIVVRNSRFENVHLGFLLSNRLDRAWTVKNNLIRFTRDSGILIFDQDEANGVGGETMTFERNLILDTGLDARINWPKHGVYDIGRNVTWRNNVIRRFETSALSLRARGNVVEGNTIAEGPYAIYAEPYDPSAATTRIAYNTIFAIESHGITIDPEGRVLQGESFVVANNTVVVRGRANGIRVIGTRGSVKVANNVVSTENGFPFSADTLPGGGLVETHNLWHRLAGPPFVSLRGTAYRGLAGYRAATGFGEGDAAGDPLLQPDLVPAPGSPAVDAGTTGFDASLRYTKRCVEGRWHYCGRTVDMGSVEVIPGRRPARRGR